LLYSAAKINTAEKHMKLFASLTARAILLPALTAAALIAGSAPANAAPAACSAYSTLQDLITGLGGEAGKCRQNGVSGPVLFEYISHSGFTASGYTFSSSGSGVNTVSFGLAYDATPFNVGAGPTEAVYTFNYKLTHDTKVFSAISNTLSSSLNLNGNTGSYQVDSTSTPADLTATLSGVSVLNGSYTYPVSPSATYLTDTFNTTLRVTSGGVENFSATYNFVNAPTPPTGTPGPLPILGAASAFGFSRNLRNKLKSKAA